MNALHVAFCLLMPAVAMWLADRFKPLKAVGPVVIAYGAGIILTNLPGIHFDVELGTTIAGGAVLLAIPLLLFSTELQKWLSLARGLLVSFACACVAAVTAAGVVGWLFRGTTDEWWKIAGMLVGVYVGGTANMSAVGFALGTRTETFAVLNTADVICGGAYFFFLLSIAPKVLGRFLKPFTADAHHAFIEPEGVPAPIWVRSNLPSMGLAFLLTVLIVAVSVGTSFLFVHSLHVGIVMLVATTLGIAASLSERVRTIRTSYELGEYALLIFCAAMGSLANASQISGASLILLSFVFIVMVASAILHFALCWVFGIDVETAIISSTATIFGPPFIGPVAASLKNRALVGPGLTLGLAGIALGTYLGLATSWVLHALSP